MRYVDKLLSQQEIPLIRNFWIRFIKYLILALVINYFLYWSLAQLDLATLRSPNNKRSAMALLMLSIMSAESWGWFFFVGSIFSLLWGDWRNFRWQSFPKGKEGNESNFDIEN